nr:MAG TPA: hypothetical protein [Bacteriophage sp.]
MQHLHFEPLISLKTLFIVLHGLLTVCGYGYIIVLYSYMQLCFICVPCKWAYYVRLCA